MIDPQGQANLWIRNKYALKKLEIIKLSEKDDFLQTLEDGIRHGTPVLLEIAGEELDPILDSVVTKKVYVIDFFSLLFYGYDSSCIEEDLIG